MVESKGSAKEMEKCVLCFKETDVPVNRHIDLRAFYVEGAGQLCIECHEEMYPAQSKKTQMN